MKTPLMELIDTLNEWADDKYCLYSDEQIRSVKDVITKATELLEKERATIEQSWEQGCLTGEGIGEIITNGSDYFTKTFTDESK